MHLEELMKWDMLALGLGRREWRDEDFPDTLSFCQSGIREVHAGLHLRYLGFRNVCWGEPL